MPELPEVETMRRGILPVQGATIVAARRTKCRLKPIIVEPVIRSWKRRVVGKMIVEVGRIGKRVVIRLDSEDSIVIEPRMTGLVLIAEPPNLEHLRFCLELENSPAERLLFWDRRGLGTVRLYSKQEMDDYLSGGRLGPDALVVSVDQLRGQFKSSTRAIKVALLDQKAVAGIGNLYASEMLHLAGIDPRQTCKRLSLNQWTALHKAMRQVLNKAIRYEGSTLGDGTYRNALNKEGSFQNHHRVYARADERCPTCRDSKIIRIVQAQRSTFFCKACQKKR